MKFKINLQKSTAENADYYYEQSKKSKSKVKGAEKALQDTLEKIEKLTEEKEKFMVAFREKLPEKKKKKKWFEKFRWFNSSEGFLVIGGRDATTNEILIKKHTEKSDVVFHADVPGAPFFVIKTEGKEVTDAAMKEAASGAASYSKAWASGTGNCDVYYIAPEQVSKSAGSGEYLTKGAFMIYGEKKWFKKVELKIAVGFKVKEDEVIGGPIDSVAANSNYYVLIGTGDKKSGELAKEIKHKFLQQAKKEDSGKIKKINPGDIQQWIPAGRGRIL